MKKSILLFFALYVEVLVVTAQRPSLDSVGVANWPFFVNAKLSADGAFAFYLTGLVKRVGRSLSVVSTDGRKMMTLDSVATASFAGDDKYLVATTLADSLVILDLIKNRRRTFGGIKLLVIPKKGRRDVVAAELMSGQWLVLRADGSGSDTVGLAGRVEFDNSGRWLLWSSNVSRGLERWSYFDCDQRQGRTFWTGSSVGTISFEGTSRKMAFLARKADTGNYFIWEYTIGADSAHCWLKNIVDQRGDSMIVENGRLDFLPAMNAWLFHVHKWSGEFETKNGTGGIRVWRYSDEYGSPMTNEVRPVKNRDFLAIAYEGSSKIVTLGMDGDWPGDPTLNVDGNGLYAVTCTAKNVKEGYRLKSERPDVYLISLKDGSRKCIKMGLEVTDVMLSPEGKYVWWYDRKERSYFTYSIQRAKVTNVGRGVATSWSDEQWDEAVDPLGYGLGAWMEGDAGMLVYDRYDIWRLDPEGIGEPKNITGGFGRSHKIKMRLVSYYSPVNRELPPIKVGEKPLLATLDEVNKANGFFRIGLDGRGALEKESMMVGEFCYFPEDISFVSFPYAIIKAESADIFLLQKMAADKFPNFYITRDFRRFVPMTSFEPEKRYNWLKAELVHWKTFEGRDGAAIVYKPTDFDSTRKYPVIFDCYEVQTPGLNEYQYPKFSTGSMNIPWFVSRGYVVVCPDIRYRVGNPGQGVYDYVMSGVNYMKEKTWVARDRIGVEGHSWGGFEVNYLVTCSTAFRCAVAASAVSNLSSLYGLEGFSNCSGPSFVEAAADRMGGPLSDSVDRYVENSPVFQARKIETPLLLMSNDKDVNVPWEQGVELFSALRRMGKKVWLLEYPDEAHNIGFRHAWDFTQRLTDFFDYYLKGGAEPAWMK